MTKVVDFSAFKKEKETAVTMQAPSQGYFFFVADTKVNCGGALIRAIEERILTSRSTIHEALNAFYEKNILFAEKELESSKSELDELLSSGDMDKEEYTEELESLNGDIQLIKDTFNSLKGGTNKSLLRLQKEGDIFQLFEDTSEDIVPILSHLLSFTFLSFTDTELADMQAKNFFGYEGNTLPMENIIPFARVMYGLVTADIKETDNGVFISISGYGNEEDKEGNKETNN